MKPKKDPIHNKRRPNPSDIKEKNTFRFKSFKERIDTVTVDWINRSKLHQNNETVESYFGEALERWTELNSTVLFTQFRREVAPLVWTLKLLLYNKEEVVAKLKEYLDAATNISAAPLLDLISSLACDLGEDFYIHLDHFMILIRNLIERNFQDTEVMEKAFNCLAHIAYALHRLMAKDLSHIICLYSPLLSAKQKPHIQQFAAESVAFLLRKAPDASALLDLLLAACYNATDSPPENITPSIEGKEIASTSPIRIAIPTEVIGRLLCEMMRGVSGRLHSCAGRVWLPLLLSRLREERVEECTRATVVCLGEAEWSREHGCEALGEVWTPLLAALMQSQRRELRAAEWRLVLLLLDIVRDTRGYQGPSVDQLEKLLLHALRSDDSPVVLKICSQFIISAPSNYNRFKLVKEIINTEKYSLSSRLEFAYSLIDTDYFDRDVLVNVNCLISHVIGTALSSGLSAFSAGSPGLQVLRFLTGVICCRSPPPQEPVGQGSGHSQSSTGGFVFAFPSFNNKISVTEFFLRVIDETMATSFSSSNVHIYWMLCSCLPHITPLAKDRCYSTFNKFYPRIITSLLSDENSDHVLPLLLSINALAQGFPDLIKVDSNLITQFNQLIHKYQEDDTLLTLSLRLVDVILHSVPSLPVTMETSSFFLGLESSKHQIRLHCLRILARLHPCPQPDSPDAITRLVSRCIEIERVVLSVYSYRDVIMHLEHLRGSRDDVVTGGNTARELIVRFLTGYLHVQFSLIWPVISNVLSSFAPSEAHSDEVFWPRVLQVLESVSEKAELQQRRLQTHEATLDLAQVDKEDAAEDAYDEEEESMQVDTKADETSPDHDEHSFHELEDPAVMASTICSSVTSQSREQAVDWFAYRLLLWKVLLLVPDQAARKTKVLSPLLLNFINKEFNVFQGKKKGDHNKTLVVILTLYGKFTNMKSIFNEKELSVWFHKLLCHRFLGIQKAAFGCIFAYRKPEITAYRENFSRILDERSFKDELRQFRLDNTEMVQPSHRTQVAKVILRILYGRLQTKDRTMCDVIFTYITACDSAELDFTIRLLFEPFLGLLGADGGDNWGTEGPLMVSLKAARDFHETTQRDEINQVALGKMQAVCKIIETFLSHLQHHLSLAHISRLLRLTLILSSVALGVRTAVMNLKQRRLRQLEEQKKADVYTEAELPLATIRLNQLKSLRQACHSLLVHMFSIEKLIWSKEELEGIKFVTIDPYLSTLQLEGASSVGIVVRLCRVWSQQVRFVHLLSGPVLGGILGLLLHPKVHKTVSEAVVEIIHNIMYDPTMTEHVRPLLLPHIETLVTYLSHRVDHMRSPKATSTNQRELELLTGCVAWDLLCSPAQCSSLLWGLLTCLACSVSRSVRAVGEKRTPVRPGGMSEETETALIRAVASLAKHTDNIDQHFKRLLPLFSRVPHRASRIVMCDVVQVASNRIHETNPDFDAATLTRLVKGLNSWDKRRIEEPDYTRREKAFQESTTLLEKSSLTQILGSIPLSSVPTSASGFPSLAQVPIPPLLYIHLCVANNAVWNLFSADDTGLRRMSVHYLTSLVAWVAAHSANKKSGDVDGEKTTNPETMVSNFRDELGMKLLIMGTMWKAVKDGVSLPEPRRVEFLELLGVIVKQFHNHHLFSGLAQLAEFDSTNLEGDFYENIKSLILSRNAKALRRLTRFLISHTLPSNLLRSPLLSLVMHFLTLGRHGTQSATLHASSDILKAALEALTALTRRLTPTHYRAVLKLCLHHLEKTGVDTNINIKCLVAILDAFESNPSSVDDVKSLSTNQPNEKMDTGADSEAVMEVDADEDVEDEETEMETKVDNSQAATVSFLMQIAYPKLERHLTKKQAGEDRHKLAQKAPLIEDETDRSGDHIQVPIALAMVKLLKKMPQKFLEDKLPRIILRICDFLRSRDLEIRKEAGVTLKLIVVEVGIRYLSFVVTCLTEQLARGYMRHVCLHTLHHILQGLEKDSLLSSDALDTCGDQILQLYLDEIIGSIAKEKEERDDKMLPPEARKVKAFTGIQRLTRHISVNKLPGFFHTLQEEVRKLKSQKYLKRMEQVFGQLQAKDGLSSNPKIDNKTMMVIAQSLTAEMLTSSQNVKKPEEDLEYTCPEREDCLLLDSQPKRDGAAPIENPRTNVHLLVDCGLQMLFGLLKRDRLSPNNQEDLEMLDPFVPILLNTIKEKYVTIVTSSVRCIFRLLRYPLPSLADNIQSIAKQLFKLISEHTRTQASVARGKQANQDLASILFKTIAALIRDRHDFKVTRTQLNLILDVVDLDLSKETGRTATAFSLLKAVLSRKLKDTPPEKKKRSVEDLELAFTKQAPPTAADKEVYRSRLTEIMLRLRSLAIQSPSEPIREQSRHCLMVHLLEYPHKQTQIDNFIGFFLRQLEYVHSWGRLSACEMLSFILRSLPILRITQSDLDAVILVQMAAGVERESAPEVRTAICMVIQKLFQVLPEETALVHYRDTILVFLRQSKRLSARLISLQLLPWILGSQPALVWRNRWEELVPLLVDCVQSVLQDSVPLEARVEEAGTQRDVDLEVEMEQEMEAEESESDGEEPLEEGKTSEEQTKKIPEKKELDLHHQLQVMDATLLHAVRLFLSLIDQSQSDTSFHKDESQVLLQSESPHSLIISTKAAPMWALIENSLLEHSYIRVRQEAAKCLRKLLKSCLDWDEDSMHPYLADDMPQRIRQLTFNCLTQFKTDEMTEEWMEIITMNMLHLCQLIHRHMPSSTPKYVRHSIQEPTQTDTPDEGEAEVEKKAMSISWILKRVNQESLQELNYTPNQITRRCAALKLSASLCVVLPSSVLQDSRILDWILVILSRESRQVVRLRRLSTTLMKKATTLSALADALGAVVEESEAALSALIGAGALAEGVARVERGRRDKVNKRKEVKDARPVVAPTEAAAKKRRKHSEAVQKKKRKVTFVPE